MDACELGRKNLFSAGEALWMQTDLNETETMASVPLPSRPCIVIRFVKDGHQDWGVTDKLCHLQAHAPPLTMLAGVRLDMKPN